MRRRRPTAKERIEAARRADWRCEYCKSPQSVCPDPFSLDHVLPTSRRGLSELSNIAFACQGCNNAKYNHTGAVDPLTGNTVRLFNPRKDRWSEHFRWDDSSMRIVGFTDIGRATIELMRLNRPELQNLRSLLLAAGQHPPTHSLE